jgi:hypothetical protein
MKIMIKPTCRETKMAKKLFFETNRDLRLEPKKDLIYLLIFFIGICFLILLTEFFTNTHAEYRSMQGRAIVVFLILFIYRLFTLIAWGQHYKEILNFTFSAQKFDYYVLVSILNVIFDLFIILCLFIWVDLSMITLSRIPIAGIVYILLIGFAALRRKRHFGKE